MDGAPPKVFISYSHDSHEHADRVLGLANRLRAEGIDSALDQYETSPPEGWPRWMDRQVDESDFVLMVCTQTYYRRVMDREEAGVGLGVRWEGNLIYQHLFDAETSNRKFVPILFDGAKPADIPRPVRGATFYFVDTDGGYESLYRRLTNQPKTARPELGQLRQITSRPRRWRATPDEAGPGQRAKVEGHHNIIVQAAGDGIHVDINRPHLVLGRPHALQRPIRSKLDLLNPFRRSVPLIGRENELAELEAWLQSDQRISVRCLIGRPYSGKTRLAVELCARMEERGWYAGFVGNDELVRFAHQENLRGWEWSAPTLIVVDNAATSARALREWLTQLSSNAGETEESLRLLLLDRHADRKLGWWPALVTPRNWDEEGLDDLFDPPAPITIAGALTSEHRRAILTAMMAEACKLAGRPEALCPPALGADLDFDRALAEPSLQYEPFCLWLAAISAVDDGLPDVRHWNCTDIAEQLAMHEIGRIHALGEDRGLDGHLLTHLAACVTIGQGCRRDGLNDLIKDEVDAERWSGTASIPSIARTLNDAAALDDDDMVRPTVPEFIGGAFVTTAWRDRSGEQQASIIRRAYARAPVPVLATVVRTAQDFGSSHDHPSLHWLDTIIRTAGDSRQLIEICDQLPDRTVNLLDRAATAQALAVARLRDELAAGAEGIRFELARQLTGLAYRYGDLGRLDDALAAVEEAVDVYRALGKADSDRAVPGLASALNCLANRLAKLGRRDDALAAAEEAVALVRWLAEKRPSGFQFDLVQSISDLATHLGAAGRRSDASRCAEEAVALYRGLAKARPDPFRLHLAISLSNLAYHRSACGESAAALAASEEAMEMLRALAATSPDSTQACLAHAANAHAVHLGAVGRADEALAAAEESVCILQRLAASHMDAYGCDLALSLNTLAGRLAQLGRDRDALEASMRALSISRDLCARNPTVFRCDLAVSLNNFAVLLAALGRNREALEAAEESVAIQRELAAQWPDRFLPDLATSLANRAGRLAEAGRRVEALDAALEAVAIRTELAAKWPSLFKSALDRSLAAVTSLSASADAPGGDAPTQKAVAAGLKSTATLSRNPSADPCLE